VEILEEKVERLEMLPVRIDNLEAQILQFREEVRAECSATRESLGSQIVALEASIGAVDERLMARLAEGHEETRRQLAVTRTELIARIAEGDDETRRYMRVLHEEVIARIAAIGERRRPRE
jgi:hypothetical protein